MRLVWGILATVAALIGLGIAWPHLQASAEAPLIGNWYADSDPGVYVFETAAGHRIEFMVGPWNAGARRDSTGSGDRVPGAQLEVRAVTTRDSSQRVTSRTTSALHRWVGLGGGYRHADKMEFDFETVHHGKMRCTVFDPIRVSGKPTPQAHELVRLDHLGLSIHWREVPGFLELRLVPGSPEQLETFGGALRIGESGDAAFLFEPGKGGDDLVARVPMAAVAGWTGFDTRAVVAVSYGGEHGGKYVLVTLSCP